MTFDFFLFTAINNLAGTYGTFDVVGIFFAKVAIIGLVFYTLRSAMIRTDLLIPGAIAPFIIIAIDGIIALFFFRERPFQTHAVQLLVSHPLTAQSFPSLHAAFAFACATLLSYRAKRSVVAAVYSIALLIAVSRIYVGVHYPSDIVAGALLGIGAVLIGLNVRKNRLKKI